jgi:4-aminobutyrate aminotransferase/(S)-3-amino-2-methylpropionate transaminase
MTSNKELLERRQQATPQGVGTQTTVFADKALNAEVWDVEGKRYVDLAAGIAVTNTGHNHPSVLAAVRSQLERFSHTCFQVTPYDVYVRLAERLNAAAPGTTPKKTIFLTTGAEAVENSVKIARRHTGRSAVIAFSGAFHGRTMMAMALTGKVMPYKAGFGPFPADVFHVPFPIDYHGVTVADSLAALQTLFSADVEPSRVAAMIIEPVQGEGGFYPAPAEFLRAIRALCDEHGIVMIVDEVQTGFARTGRLFACEHAGIEPDLMPVAKSLAGGFPLSGVIGKAEIMDAVPPGGLGGTYGGSPLACAAGLAVLDVIDSERLCEKAERLGEIIRAWATDVQSQNNAIGHVRGIGAMCAIELVQDGDASRPDPELTRAVAAAALEEGVLLLTCGVRGNVIRFLPPLTIEESMLRDALATLGDVIGRLTGAVEKAS